MSTADPGEIADLYAAIIARVKGEQANSVGHRGRTVAYSTTSLGDMVKLYRMLWFRGCGSPELPSDLDASVATRGCFRVRLR